MSQQVTDDQINYSRAGLTGLPIEPGPLGLCPGSTLAQSDGYTNTNTQNSPASWQTRLALESSSCAVLGPLFFSSVPSTLLLPSQKPWKGLSLILGLQ